MVLALLSEESSGGGFEAPTVEEFFPAPLYHGAPEWLTKFPLFLWTAVAVVLLYYLLSYRNPKLVPTKKQWLAESIYGFARNNIGKEMIGAEGVKFAPYLATLFSIILIGNFMALVPGLQVSPYAHIAFPMALALISYVVFITVGIRRHGVGRFFKNHLMPPAPWFMQPILIPIEFISTFLARPFTLALRLFANMFAGHMILLIFTLGGFALLNAQTLWLKPLSLLSFGMAIALTFLELLVVVIQAYIFSVLTASYIGGALAEEH